MKFTLLSLASVIGSSQAVHLSPYSIDDDVVLQLSNSQPVRVPQQHIQQLIQTSLEPDMKLDISISMEDEDYQLTQQAATHPVVPVPPKEGMVLEIDGVKYNLIQLKNVEEKPKLENGETIKMDGLYFFVHERQNRNSFVQQKAFNRWEAPLDLGLSIEVDGKKFNLVQANSSATFVPAEHLGMTIELDGKEYQLMQMTSFKDGNENEDLNMVISMDGMKFKLVQKKQPQALAQHKFEPAPSLGMTIEIDGRPYKLAQGDADSELGMTITIDGKKYQISQ